MSENVVRLADVKSDSALWSVRDCLVAMIEDIDKGEIDPDCVAIHYFENLENGRMRPGYYLANMNHEKHIGMLHVAIQDCCDRWRGVK